MRPTPPHPKLGETKEERENKLKAFILEAIEGAETKGDDAIAVLAQSPESPVARAVMALSDTLAHRGIGAAIVLAGGATAAEDETWSLVFSAGFIHEIRLTSNPRILDGHEQLIVADRAVWFGDCMRRDPMKRDAFAQFLPDRPAEARAARAMFARLWRGAHQVFANPEIAAVSMAHIKAADDALRQPRPAVEIGEFKSQGLAAGADETGALLETLAAWQPATRH